MSSGRDGFGTGLGAFTATVASAVGLGNIWKFPFLAGVNGGAAFVFTYLIAVALVGLPILAAEHAIGRRMRLDAVRAYGTAVPGEGGWRLIGFGGIAAAFLIMAFYTDVAGWVFAYVVKAFGSALRGGSVLGPEVIGSLSSGIIEPVAWQLGVIVLVASIVAGGVSGGIEKATRFTMPVLLTLLILCDIRALTLPGAFAGVEFLLKPDFSRLSGAVILSALGLAFFKLSLGMGTMTTYGSYLPDSTRIVPNAGRVALADTLVSLLAGLAIFPAVFAFGFEPSAGPALLFISIPAIFSRIPAGSVFTIVFFALAALATVGAMVSLMEVPTAWLCEKGGMSRRRATMVTAGTIFLFGIPTALSLGPLAEVKIFGLVIFDLFDYIQQNLLLPLGGLAIAVVAAWRIKKSDLLGELGKGYGGGRTPGYVGLVYTFIRWVAPLLIVLVFLNGIGLFAA